MSLSGALYAHHTGIEMTLPKEMQWARDPHTAAKHAVLAGYYDAWFPIMLQAKWPRLTVFEGFAGPGEYTGGEEGSPLVALRGLLDRPKLVEIGKPIRFIFVEERADRLEHLRALVAGRFPNMPAHIQVEYHEGECEGVWEKAFTDARAWGQPIFANLDPFGPGVPFQLVKLLGGNPGSEVLVTFMSDWLCRFAKVEHLDDGNRMFHSESWRTVATMHSPVAKEHFLVEEYRRTLASVDLRLSAPFKMMDEGGHAYYLIFATGNLTGLARMKAAMWKIDPEGGITFRDPRHSDQGVLEFGVPKPSLASLRRSIVAGMVAGQWYTVARMRELALTETDFRDVHVPDAIRAMIENEELVRDPPKGQLTKATRVRLA